MTRATERTIDAAGAADRMDETADEGSFAIDTALSWDGALPAPGVGDYLVTVGTVDGDRTVLVSRRYVGAVDASDAGSIALDAVAERNGYDTDDEGNILPIDGTAYGAPGETGMPAWIDTVYRVTDTDGDE